MMNKAIAIFAICLFISSLMFSAYAELYISPTRQVEMMTAFDDTLWIGAEEELSVYDSSTEDVLSLGNFKGLTALAADDSTSTVELLCSNDVTQRITILDVDGRIYEDFPLANQPRFTSLAREDQLLYLLSAEEGQIYTVPVDGEYPPQTCTWVDGVVTAFTIYNGLLYTLYEVDGELAVYDIASEAEIARCAVPDVAAFTLFPYAEGTYPVAIWRNGLNQVSILDVADASALTSSIAFDEGCAALCVSRTALYTLSADRTSVTCLPLTELDDTNNVLYLVNCTEDLDNGRMERAVELFRQRYPGVNIVRRWIDDPRALTTALMSGDMQIDVLFVQEGMLTSSSIHLLLSGATMDLQQFECIEDLPWDDYAFSRAALTAGDSLYGLPFTIEFFPWAVNDLLLQEMELQLPEDDWTWDDLFALADAVEAYNQEHGTEWLLLDDSCFTLPALFYQYGNAHNDLVHGTADYSNEEFIGYARQWLSVVSRGLAEDSGITWMEPREDALFTVCAGMSSQNLGGGHWILPPKLNDGHAFPLDITTMQISSNSKHPEMAAWFMACCLNEDALSSQSLAFQPLLLKDWQKYPGTGNADLDDDEVLSEENLNLWLKALTEGDHLIWYHDLYRDQWREFYPALLDGQFTPEAFAAACQQQADMVLGE